ncbi:MAG TPA: hypothetical protein VN026_05140 [Bacteroidia bacterium]|nr:hypothetical protein [Bacteroidia bacterium]
MKKIILTLSFVALFSVVSKAQDSKSKHTQEPVKTVVNSDGTTTTVTASSTPAEQTPAKKGGTRMAINEKGLPGGSTAKKEPAKEEKAAPVMGQPGSSNKKGQ